MSSDCFEVCTPGGAGSENQAAGAGLTLMAHVAKHPAGGGVSAGIIDPVIQLFAGRAVQRIRILRESLLPSELSTSIHNIVLSVTVPGTLTFT